jgi:excisionase family DNA binding protein
VAEEDRQATVETLPGQLGGKLLLSVRESAWLLGVSPATIRRAIASGRLEHIRLGDRVLIRREALEAFIDLNTIPTSKQGRGGPDAYDLL